MSDDRPISEDPGEEGMPALLRADLVQLDQLRTAIPGRLDARILSSAKSGYSKRMIFRRPGRWLMVAGTLAATVAILLVLHAEHLTPLFRLAREDINRNGKVDMLDAYVLAKKIDAGEKLDPKWDVNGDGVVDQADVDWIANAAVHISESDRQ
jgi:hypothetical protein